MWDTTLQKILLKEREFVVENERGRDTAMIIDLHVVLSRGQEEKTVVI